MCEENIYKLQVMNKNVLKMLSIFFRRFSGSGELRRLWSDKLKIETETMRTITPSLHAQKISAS